jgi:hypothetical protein
MQMLEEYEEREILRLDIPTLYSTSNYETAVLVYLISQNN